LSCDIGPSLSQLLSEDGWETSARRGGARAGGRGLLRGRAGHRRADVGQHRRPAAVSEAADWPTAGRDLANTRAVPGARLSRDTIGDATELWRAPLPDAGALTTVPPVVDGTVYVQGATGQVVAVDLASGEVEWASEPSGGNIGPFGVAVDGERAYAPLDKITR
jgi:glucose dehydrogenase